MAENNEVNIILSALILDMVLSGLKTLSTLNEFKLLLLLPYESFGSHAVITITKSNIFQGSYK